jgi:hypothetical protein
MVKLYPHSPICLDVIVLNELTAEQVFLYLTRHTMHLYYVSKHHTVKVGPQHHASAAIIHLGTQFFGLKDPSFRSPENGEGLKHFTGNEPVLTGLSSFLL